MFTRFEVCQRCEDSQLQVVAMYAVSATFYNTYGGYREEEWEYKKYSKKSGS